MAWRTIILAVFALCLLSRLTAVPADLPDSVAAGDAALAAGHLAEAIDAYRRAAAYPEGAPAVALKIARAQMEIACEASGDANAEFQAARDAWLDALAVEGPGGTAARGLAETSLALGDAAGAQEWAAGLVEAPASTSFWYALARAHLEDQEWALAGQAYAAIAAAEPGNSESHYWAGLLLMDSNAPASQHHLARAQDEERFQEPADMLLRVLEQMAGVTDPAYRAAQLGLGYLNVGEPVLARHYLLAAVGQEPTYADAWAYLGLAEDQLGEDGRRAIARAIELQPESPLAHTLMGHHWLGHDEYALARQSFLVVWELDRQNPMSMVDVASTYGMEGDYTSAEAWYRAAIRLAPEEASLWVMLARFHLDTLNDVTSGGLLAAQKAVALAPEDPAALETLGWAQFLAGQPRLAETNLLAARERDPSNPAIPYHLGRLYESLDDAGRARVAFQDAITLDSSCFLCPSLGLGQYAELASRALDEMGGR